LIERKKSKISNTIHFIAILTGRISRKIIFNVLLNFCCFYWCFFFISMMSAKHKTVGASACDRQENLSRQLLRQPVYLSNIAQVNLLLFINKGLNNEKD